MLDSSRATLSCVAAVQSRRRRIVNCVRLLRFFNCVEGAYERPHLFWSAMRIAIAEEVETRLLRSFL